MARLRQRGGVEVDARALEDRGAELLLHAAASGAQRRLRKRTRRSSTRRRRKHGGGAVKEEEHCGHEESECTASKLAAPTSIRIRVVKWGWGYHIGAARLVREHLLGERQAARALAPVGEDLPRLDEQQPRLADRLDAHLPRSASARQ
eukprot:5241572-Pleurochrysis_carterae.AAC.1